VAFLCFSPPKYQEQVVSTIQLARYIISFSWIYHGIFPKLIHIAPLEKQMTDALGFTEELSYLITKAAGVGEVIFGIVFFVLYKSNALILLNIIGMVGLLVFVVLCQSTLLIEAFNPVTTNIPLIGMSLILLKELDSNSKQYN